MNASTLNGTPAPLPQAEVAYLKKGSRELEMENQILGAELLRSRDQYWNMRLLALVLAVALVFLAVTHPKQWVLVVAGVFFFLTASVMLIGGLCFSAKRGDEAMGIGNTQGRDQ